MKRPSSVGLQRTAANIALASLTLAACSLAVPVAPTEPATSDSAVPRASMRAFIQEDVAALHVQDGDLAGGSVSPGQDPIGESSTVAWTRHLEDHGLQGRWWRYLDSLEDSPLGYGYIGGAGVSLWADGEAAVEALAFENGTPRVGISVVRSLEAPELGHEAWCGVLDFPPALNDRAWCRFSVSNATFDLWMRTGDRLDPRAIGDLADAAVRLRQRAEDVAADSGG